jgi:elongation factor Tu
MQTSGQQKFIGVDKADPGDIVKAEIAILSPHFFLKQLFVGIEFEFREGSRIVGTGKILEILNRDLLAV